MDLVFARFSPLDFDEFVSWYDDLELWENLGPAVDRQWLNYVLEAQDEGFNIRFLKTRHWWP